MDIQNYVPIQTLDLEAEKQLSFDLYLRLPLNHRVLLYRRKGGAIEGAKLANLVDGNISNFWIRKEDYGEFVRYVAVRLKNLIEGPVSETSRQMIVMTAKAMLSSTVNASDSAVVKILMDNLNEITGHLISAALADISPGRRIAYKKFLQIAEKGTDFHKHPVNVSSLAVLMAFGVGYSTSRILSEVAMGALLHDIGLAKLPAKISSFAYDPLSLSPEERRELCRHGELALEILNERKIKVSEIARSIIMQHHEQFNGAGYPAGLRGYVLNEFAQIVRVADDLDNIIRFSEGSAENIRSQVEFLFQNFASDKIIAPELCGRIRPLFLP